MTCICERGEIHRLHCEYDSVDMVWDEGKFVFRPKLSEEDPDTVPDDALLRQLAAMENAAVRDPITIPGGGRPIHDIVMNDWPQGGGDPKQLLDLGTGYDFLDLDSRFTCVAAHAITNKPNAQTPMPPTSPVVPPPKKKKGLWQRLFGG